LNKYFSRTGDDGTSMIRDGIRLDKSDLVFELLGDLDESCAFISLACLHLTNQANFFIVERIKKDLNDLMADIAGDKKSGFSSEKTQWLEAIILEKGTGLLMPKGFVQNWNVPASALMNIARTVIRRAERVAVAFSRAHPDSNPYWLVYLNRISSLLFVLQLEIENPPSQG
jgi:cob(I)alamin adenosyltransferase